MQKIILHLISLFLFIYNGRTQTTPIDKARIMDYFQNQQYDEIIKYLNPLITTDSANLQALNYIGYASFMNENIADAKKYYERIITIDSTNVPANHYMAMINNGNPVVALAFTRRLINLQPARALYYRNMADLFKKMNQKDSALAYYYRAYYRAPTDYKNAVSLSDLLIEKRIYSTADSILETGLARDSLNIPFLRLRVRSAYEAKDFQHALLPGERLIRLADISLSALIQLALSYYNLKMYNDCIRVCDFMIDNDLNTESVYYYQAKSYAKLKDYNKSNELLQICLTKAISKTAELYYYTLGENDEAVSQFKNAVKQYDSAFYLFKSPLMKYYAGHVYEINLKNEPLARKYYLQYLLLAMPESADEKKAYEYIKEVYGKKRKKSR